MVECQFVALNVVGSNPITHPLFTKKLKKNKTFFENIKFIQTVETINLCKKNDRVKFKRAALYGLHYVNTNKNKLTLVQQKENINKATMVSITQKKHNPKASFYRLKTTFTITLGVCLKYLKIHTTKALRRDFKYTKYFLNLVKVMFFKEKRNLILFSLRGLDYNSLCLKKLISNLFTGPNIKLFFLFSIKIPFCKIKGKKVKAIKKRLKKKILLDFLEK